jgi:hypothetical protein
MKLLHTQYSLYTYGKTYYITEKDPGVVPLAPDYTILQHALLQGIFKFQSYTVESFRTFQHTAQ